MPSPVPQISSIITHLISLFFLSLPLILVLPACLYRLCKQLLFLFTPFAKRETKDGCLHYNPFRNVHQDVFKIQMLTFGGFTIREYTCLTRDSVQLLLWRITYQKTQQQGANVKPCHQLQKQPILLQHGLMDCSMSWFILKQNCLPFLLAKQGFDVWVSNNRGTKYTTKNINEQNVYWQYSLDHIIEFDVPCLIDHVLKQTGKQKLIYIGHSQGTTQFLSSLDMHSEIASKIQCFIGLGPVISLKNVKNHLPLYIMDKLRVYQVMRFLGFRALLTFPLWMNKLVGLLMFNSGIFHWVCMQIVNAICGVSREGKICSKRFGVILSHQPGGCSIANALHWVQVYQTGYFRKFDYGHKKNIQLYENSVPPLYSYQSLKEIPFQCYLFKGTADTIVNDKDFQYLTNKLHPQRHRVYVVKDYAHLDYLWSQTAQQDIYNDIINILTSKPNYQNQVQNIQNDEIIANLDMSKDSQKETNTQNEEN